MTVAVVLFLVLLFLVLVFHLLSYFISKIGATLVSKLSEIKTLGFYIRDL